ncbi:MAG: thioredoxin [Thermoprotei archaeon]|nr:MAG: thioredoxin [Thermoprotei archaeon]
MSDKSVDEEKEILEKLLRKLIEQGKKPSTPVIELDEMKLKEVLKRHKFVVVDFWAPWCLPCRKYAPIFRKVAEQYEREVIFGKVNVEKYPSLAVKFHVMSIPTTIIFVNGHPVKRMIGAVPERDLKEALTEILSRFD